MQRIAKCLIVDDSRVVMEAVFDYLSDMGHDVERATDGEEALRVLESRNDFDLLFLDVHLPGIDGVEILKQVCQNWPKIKVIIMTSDRDSETFEEVEATDARIAGFLHKPFDRDILEMCVDTIWVKGGRYLHKKQDLFD